MEHTSPDLAAALMQWVRLLNASNIVLDLTWILG
jgi:hypothetical protein